MDPLMKVSDSKRDWGPAEEVMLTEPHSSAAIGGQPHEKANAATFTYRQLDDLVEHDIWGHMEIEDEVLKEKGQR